MNDEERVAFILGNRTRTDLAAAAGLKLSHVSRILKGSRTPNVKSFRKIAEALNLSMDALYDRMYVYGAKKSRKRTRE
jgi:transcriptional regulator with XRE-family HTH domain